MAKPRLNRDWHATHKMPMNATLEQRTDWHLAHIENCGCRKDLPPTIRKELERRGIDVEALLAKHASSIDEP